MMKKTEHIPEENEEPLADDGAEVTVIPDAEDNGAISGQGGESEAIVRKLKKKLVICEKERQENLLGWQRAKADFVNARREEEETRKKFFSLAKEDTLLSFLPVADSFELAFANKESWDAIPEGWRKGIEYIHAQLVKIFEEQGIRAFGNAGEPFDPIKHESVESISTENESEGGVIVAVLQKGYELNGKIIRPARVKVGVYQP